MAFLVILLVAVSLAQFAIGQNCCSDMPNIIKDINSRIAALDKDNKACRADVDALKAQQDKVYHDCKDIKSSRPNAVSGVYAVVVNSVRVPVYCDMATNGGGWTVFQRRKDGTVEFKRTWAEYAAGFGNRNGEFWLGNDNLAALLAQKTPQVLRIELEDWKGNKRYAEYSNFKVLGAGNKYKLESLGAYSGDAGNSMHGSDDKRDHLGQFFTTLDQDNDKRGDANCAVQWNGAWWYNNCHETNLNGEYKNNAKGKGINWNSWTGFELSLKAVEMKFRASS